MNCFNKQGAPKVYINVKIFFFNNYFIHFFFFYINRIMFLMLITENVLLTIKITQTEINLIFLNKIFYFVKANPRLT